MKAGAEIDFLSPEELHGELDKFKKDFIEHLRADLGLTVTRSGPTFATDAAGDTTSLPSGGGVVYTVPIGYDAFMTRLSVDYETSDAATPATCDVRVCADQVTPAALRAINNQVPTVYEASKSHAPLFRGGQNIVVAVESGPVSTTFYCTVQVILVPRRHVAADVMASME